MNSRALPQTTYVSDALISHPDFCNRLSRFLFLSLAVIIPWVFADFTSHTIVLKSVALDLLVVWALAARWIGLRGFRPAEAGPSGDNLLLAIVAVTALVTARYILLGASLPEREPGYVEVVSDVASMLLIFALAWPLIQELKKEPCRGCLIAMAVWIAALFITTILSQDRIQSVNAMRQSVAYAAAGLLALDVTRTRRGLHSMAVLMAAVTLSLGVYGLFQSFGLDFFLWKDMSEGLGSGRRISGPMGNPDFFGGFLAGILPLCIAIACGLRNRRIQILSLLGLFLGAISLYMTGTKGALVGIAAGLAVFVFLIFLRNGWMARGMNPAAVRKWWVVAPVLALIILLLSGIPLGLKLKNTLASNEARSISTQSRYWMWVGTARIWKSSPIHGVGPGNFANFFPDFRPVELSEFQPPDLHRVSHAHSEYLELASEMGLIGIFAFFFMLAAFVRTAIKTMLASRDRFHQWMILGALGSLVGLLAHNVITVNLRWTSSLFLMWCLLGIMASRAGTPAKGISRRLPLVVIWRVRYPVLIAALVAACSVTVYQGCLLLADIYAANGKAILAQRLPSQAAIRFQRALRLDPRRNETRYFLASAYFDNNMNQQALDKYDDVIRIGRNFVNVVFNKATVLGRMGRLDDAIAIYREAVKADPNYARLYDYMGRMYFQKAIKEPNSEKKQEARKMAYAECGRAITLYERTIEGRRWDAVLHKDYGICLLLCGEFDRALAALKEAQRLDPDLQGVQTFLEYAVKAGELEKEQGREKVMDMLINATAGG